MHLNKGRTGEKDKLRRAAIINNKKQNCSQFLALR